MSVRYGSPRLMTLYKVRKEAVLKGFHLTVYSFMPSSLAVGLAGSMLVLN